MFFKFYFLRNFSTDSIQTYSTVRSIDSRSHVQPKIVSTKLFSYKRCVSYMLSLYLGQGLHCSQVTCYACFFVVCYFLFKTTLNFSGIPSKCQTVWIQIKPNILSCLIWVQLICKGYQRPTLVSRQIYAITAKIS